MRLMGPGRLNTTSWLRCIQLTVLCFVIALPTVSALAQDSEADDYVPILNRSELPSTSATKEQGSEKGALPPDLDINTLDTTNFPEICSYVTVLDSEGNPIGGLDSDSFCVWQDENKIDSFSVTATDIDSCRTNICLVIDRSGSMSDGGKMAAARAAARHLVRQMNPFDSMAIVSFANCTTLNRSFTNDTTALIAAINALSASGRTAALDGIYKGVNLTKLRSGSKAVIALSDGMENNSGSCAELPDGLGDGFADDSTLIVNLAKTFALPIYTISLGSDFDPQYMLSIANGSGGDYFHAPTGAQLEGIYDEIKMRLCARYLICYTSPDTILNGDCHDVIICQRTVAGACSPCDTGEYCEPNAPVIAITVEPACRRWGLPLQLCANVTDSDTPIEDVVVKLYYRIFEPGGAFSEVTPFRFGNNFCYTIPANLLPCGKDSVEFYFTASDGLSLVRSPLDAPATTHQVTICQNSPPICEFGATPQPPICSAPIDFVSLNLTDPDGNGKPCTLTGDGQLVPGGWQNNNPVPGTTAYATINCEDSCGATCSISFERFYPVRENVPCNLPDGGDTSIFLCDPGMISIPVSGATGSICRLVSGAGQIVGGVWQYNATQDEIVTFTVECAGLCDNCFATYTVEIDVNESPICGRETKVAAHGLGCDVINFSDHFTLTWTGVVYNGDNSTWCYDLLWDGVSPGLSHLTIQLCDTLDNDNLVSSSPEGAAIGPDGATGLYGIKWDSEDLPSIPANTPVSFCFTLDRPLAVAQTTFVPKAGQNDDIVGICGPNTNCQEGDPGPGPCPEIALCEPGPVCIPFGAVDPDGNLEECHVESGVGTYANGCWYFQANETGEYHAVIVCTDECGDLCRFELCADVVVNRPPVVMCEFENVDRWRLHSIAGEMSPPPYFLRLDGFFDGNSSNEVTFGADEVWLALEAGRLHMYGSLHVAEFNNGAVPPQYVSDWLINVWFDEITLPAELALIDDYDPTWKYYDLDPTTDPELVNAADPNDRANFWDFPFDGSKPFRIGDGGNGKNLNYGGSGWLTFEHNDNGTVYGSQTVHMDASDFLFDLTPCVLICRAGEICASVSASDPDNDPLVVASNWGPVINGQICLEADTSGTYTLIVRATDVCENVDYDTCTICVELDAPPEITCPGPISVQCAKDVPAPDISLVTASDDNGPPTVTWQGDTPLANGCGGTITRTYRATDACGSYVECTQTITVDDTQDPTVTSCPDDGTVECPGVPVFGTPVFADNCDQELTVTYVDASVPGNCAQERCVTRTWTATDDCDNTATCDQRICVEDNTKPAVTFCPDDATVECPGLPIFGTPIFTDLCDAELSVTYADVRVEGNCLAEYCVTRTWTATDDCGNTETCDQRICVEDNAAPTLINCETDSTFQCHDIFDKEAGSILLPPILPGAIDICDQTPTVQFEILLETGSWPCSYHIRYAIWAVDDCGNASERCIQNLYIVDTTDPVIVCPAPTRHSCDQGNNILNPPSATDNCSQPTVTEIDRYREDSTCPYGYTTVVVYEARDRCDNTDTCEYRVTVYDDTPPVLKDCDTLVVYECDFEKDVNLIAPTLPVANDNCDPDPAVDFELVGTGGAYPCDAFLLFAIWAEDTCGNISDRCFQRVMIVDRTDPVITCPDDVRYECDNLPAELPRPTAKDNCSEPTITEIDRYREDSTCSYQYTTVIVYEARDLCGNTDTCEHRVSIYDDTPPDVACPDDERVSCDDIEPGDFDGNRFGWAKAVDNCDPTPEVYFCGWEKIGDGCPYIIRRCFTAVDTCGNGGDTCYQDITVYDEVDPEIACPENRRFECDASVPVSEWGWATATDNCTAEPRIALIDQDTVETIGDCYKRIVRKFAAFDLCNNSDTCEQEIIIGDATDPVCNIPGDMTIFLCDLDTTICLPVSATDNCDQNVVCAVADGPGEIINGEWCYRPEGAGAVTVYIRCLDDCGNGCSGNFTITFEINVPPIVIAPPDRTVFLCKPDTICIGPFPEFDPNRNPCRNFVAPWMWMSPPQVCFEADTSGVYVIWCCQEDCCGAIGCDSTVVTVVINTPPVCNVPDDQTIYLCDPAEISLPVSATDADGGPVVCEILNGPGILANGQWTFTPEEDGRYCVTIRCEDACTTACEAMFCVTVDITEPPTCIQTDDMTIAQCDPAQVCLPVGLLSPNPPLSGATGDTRNSSKGGKSKSGGTRQQSPSQPQGEGVSGNKGEVENCTVLSGPGTIIGGFWCYTPPDNDEVVSVVVQCEDTCGHKCENAFTVSFDINEDPVCSLGVDLVDPICTPEKDFVPLGSRDPEGGELECYLVGPGSLVPGGWELPNPVPGTSVAVKIVCSDTCGDSCIIEFTRNYPERIPVDCTTPDDIDTLLCSPQNLSFPVSGGADATCRVISGPGSVVDGYWTYYADEDASFAVTIRCLSLCDSCEATFNVTVDLNDPPLCILAPDTAFFQCVPTEVCLPIGATDVNGNLNECTFDVEKGFTVGEIRDGFWCYTPSGDQTVVVYIVCRDSCGAECRDQFEVTFDINEPPVCIETPDASFFQCVPTEVCLPIGATDADGNLEACVLDDDKGGNVGEIRDGFWCYTPSGDETFTVYIVCRDSCGATCRDEFEVRFKINEPPTCSEIRDTSIFLCESQEICLPFTSSDANGNLANCEVISGASSLSQGFLCFTPTQSGLYSFTIRCTDDCGATCEESFTADITINTPPTCQAPNDTTIALCDPGLVCLPFGGSDVDGNLTQCSVIDNLGTTVGSEWCQFIGSSQKIDLTFICEDACGARCEKVISVNFVINQPPICEFVPLAPPACTPPVAFVPFTSTDPEGGPTTCTLVEGKGELIEAGWQYVDPIPGESFQVVITCEDTCGAKCKIEFFASFPALAPPVCNLPNDTTIFQCAPAQVQLPASAAGAECEIISGPGVLDGGFWKYTPSAEGPVTVTIRCSNGCESCQETFTVTFDFNEPPICSLPANQAICVCPGDAACLPITASDPNNNLVGCELLSGPGSIVGNLWCYTPTFDAEYTLIVRCWDACNRECRDTVHVILDVNDPPIFPPINDTTITVCNNNPICIPVLTCDGNLNLSGVQLISGGGSLVFGTDTTWCVTPPSGTTVYNVTIRVTDICDAVTERSFKVTTIKPQAPSCALPPNATYTLCAAGQVCFPVQNGSPLGVTCALIDGPGSLINGQWCLNVTTSRTASIKVRCTNACGQVCENIRTYTFLINPADCGGPASIGDQGGTVKSVSLTGDVDGSGEINIADLTMLMRIVQSNNRKPSSTGLSVSAASAGYPTGNADINCDGSIDRADIAALTSYLFESGLAPCAQ